jgi:hypothetical protein
VVQQPNYGSLEKGSGKKVNVRTSLRRLTLGVTLATTAALGIGVAQPLAFASAVNESVLDTTSPTVSVTTSPGASTPVFVELQITGPQTNPATVDVDRDWTLKNGVFTGHNPQTITVPARGASDPATLLFPSAGTLTVDPSQATGGPFTLAVTPYNVVTSGTNKLHIGAASNYQVTVVPPPDSVPPVLSVPANFVAEAADGTGVTVTYTVSANDAVDGPVTPTCSPASGTKFAIGTTTVTCTATDAHHNTATKTFTVTVGDTTAPVVAAPSDVVLEATGPAGATYTYSVSASDTVDGSVTPSCSPASGSTFALGDTTVTCTATDAHSNTGTASFKVTVKDTTAPSLTTSGDFTAEATGPNGAVVTYLAQASDLVDGSVTPSCSKDSGTTFALGDTTVTCTATDAHGNSSPSVSFTVTVVDTTPPTITAPNVTKEATGPNTDVTLSATATDLVDGSVPVTYDKTGPFPVGTTTVTATATDNAGNKATKQFDVVVTDKTPPTITASDVSKEATGPTTSVAIGATAVDLVDGPVSVSYSDNGPFTVGAHTVTVPATDAHGNTATKNITVTVTDTTAPAITAPDVTKEATGPTTPVTFAATAVDLVDGPVSVTYDQNGPFALGTYTITASATDAHGNKATKTFSLTVQDTTAPVVTVPADLGATATSAAGATVNFTVTVHDAVDGSPSVNCSAASGSVFPIGTTTVSCTATDASHNTSAAKTFNVTVTLPWNGILQPINADGSSLFKLGSTVPVKFANFPGLHPTLKWTQSDNTPDGTSVEALSSNPADTGNLFRWDDVAKQYVFNLGTKNLLAGDWYLYIDQGDGILHRIKISLKK